MLKPESAIRNPQFVLFTGLIVAVYLLGLTIPLVGPDEPRYAQVAREMWQSGDWITPTLGGHNWFEKPALLYWLQIVAYSLFGPSEFSARLGPALFGLGTIASVYIFGRIIERNAEAAGIASWVAIIAASSIGLLVFSRGASFDIIVTFPITAAMMSFFAFDQGEEEKAWPLVFFYFFIGVAVLAKGLIGALFPLAIVAAYYLASRKVPPRRFVTSLFWGGLISIAVAAAWYVPMYAKHGWEFIDQFFIQHHFQRFASDRYRHPQPFYFFFWVLPLMTLPWLPLLAGSIGSDVKKRAMTRPKLFAYCWLFIPLIFFSFSGSKLPGYILPSLPPALILAGVYASSLAGRAKAWRLALAAVAALMLIGSATLILTVVPNYAEADSAKGLFAAASAKGINEGPVAVIHHYVHSAEFYAAGRMVRESDGRQKLLQGPGEIAPVMQDGRVLLLIPNDYLERLMTFPALKFEFIAQNAETTLVLARSN
jgi:4-amino-4-deoxy-L-arabinose transferase-like glycosyltransferase